MIELNSEIGIIRLSHAVLTQLVKDYNAGLISKGKLNDDIMYNPFINISLQALNIEPSVAYENIVNGAKNNDTKRNN